MSELLAETPRLSIPGLAEWLETPQGRYVAAWESAHVDAVVADVFGFNALQLGMPECDFLRANRIPMRQKAGEAGAVDVLCSLEALPFASHSTDLVILPHVLEFHPDPHQVLREVERILIPEGQVVILAFNPLSLWGLRRRFGSGRDRFPWSGHYLSPLRLRDWLKLLGFETDRGAFGCYAPPFRQEAWLRRWRFLELAGDRWWGFGGGVYLLRAVKRTHGLRLIMPNWKKTAVRGKALRPVAQREIRLD
ncbi:MAG TPA: class I SAM-dependent methyltransferase [Rhodocyclaceae bacterium]|jgi:SAM-dependent methyltransferase|nr:class I SAM-dependent methyltransferase [Rhodocyclaceae bacterium]HMV21412.1 class I SAM-dependent methyltransferase [Rhodocyclaceae bacterium]HNE41928.1 class I SAM-dependent methyltransferase [Rhodocyclaceae bacterium]HNL22003.1 class I SAM-dependent methyltransferase [Rhodocyclaceae bacterium]HNM22822.1 class I SAM-dependent methyltransferase [Rhodocyclaceae bacterium]